METGIGLDAGKRKVFSTGMRFSIGFNIKMWAAGVSVGEKVPLAGYVDGVQYMCAVENRLIVLFIGPVAFRCWIGPQPQEMP
jgi:hypothetical protein